MWAMVNQNQQTLFVNTHNLVFISAKSDLGGVVDGVGAVLLVDAGNEVGGVFRELWVI